MKRNIALAMALPVLTLALGVAIGCAIWRSEPVETEVIPATSLSNFSRETLKNFCAHSAVFSDFMRPDAMSEGVREQRAIRALQMAAIPLSDRGVICTLSASVLTRRTQPNGNAIDTSGDTRVTYIVAINSDSEIVSEDFAKALLQSKTVQVMASNFGNEGTVVPKVKVGRIQTQ